MTARALRSRAALDIEMAPVPLIETLIVSKILKIGRRDSPFKIAMACLATAGVVAQGGSSNCRQQDMSST